MKPSPTFQPSAGTIALPVLVVMLSLFSSAAFAQEHSFGKEEISTGNGHETVLDNHNHDTDHARLNNSGMDSIHIQRSVVTRPRSKNSESTSAHQAEAAKFNFLYFIIEKFKITDIID